MDHVEFGIALFDGDEMIVVAEHDAGTSNPRYNNAVYFLSDLGYLEDGRVTSLGLKILDRIREQGVAP